MFPHTGLGDFGMKLLDDITRTYNISEHALAKIKANELAAFPANYEIWFAYAAGFNPALNKRINEILRAGEHVSQEALEAIREDLTSAELAKKHHIHPTMISGWKKAAIENMASMFNRPLKKC